MQRYGCALVVGVVEARSPCVQRVVYPPVECFPSPSPLRCPPRLPALNKQATDQCNDSLCHTKAQCAGTDKYTTACLQGALEAEDVLAGMHCCALCHDPATLSP